MFGLSWVSPGGAMPVVNAAVPAVALSCQLCADLSVPWARSWLQYAMDATPTGWTALTSGSVWLGGVWKFLRLQNRSNEI